MLADSFSGRTVSIASQIFDVPTSHILEGGRFKPYVRVRQAVLLTLRDVTKISYPKLGRIFGLDHSTVMHSVAQAKKIATTNEEYATKLAALLNEARTMHERRAQYVEQQLVAQKRRAVAHMNLPERIKTSDVLEVAGYGIATLQRRIREGKMPQPIDKAGSFIFNRDEVLQALGLMHERPVVSSW